MSGQDLSTLPVLWDTEPVMGEIFAGRYELVDLLGTGGMGDVWRIWDHRDGGYRAGKVLRQSDSTSLLRFMREARWRFDHPHLLAPSGWAGEDDRIIFAMPLVHGGSAAGLLRDYGPLPQTWVLPAIGQLLEALHVIHSAGLVHRDVKPANILLRPGTVPDIVLSDFGTAAPIAEPRLTRVTQVIGTPGYMSPEARYGADPEPAQDLYAVGILLIELLTGARPGQDEPAQVPPRFAGTPLGNVIAHLIADVPARVTSAAQAWRELAAVVPEPQIGEPVEVFDQIEPLPAGWGPQGPLGTGSQDTGLPSSPSPGGLDEFYAPPPARAESGQALGQEQFGPSPGWAPASHQEPVPFQEPAPFQEAAPAHPAAPLPAPANPGPEVVPVGAPPTPATVPAHAASSTKPGKAQIAPVIVVAGGVLCILAAIIVAL